jgi:hypothetical protein
MLGPPTTKGTPVFDLSSDEYYNDLAIWGDDSDFNDSDFDESFDNWFDEDDDGYYGGEDAAMEAGLFGWDA